MADEYWGFVWSFTCISTDRCERGRRPHLEARRPKNGTIQMLCVLCQHDESLVQKLLCEPCLEMIGRLQEITELINAEPMKRKAAAAKVEYGTEN